MPLRLDEPITVRSTGSEGNAEAHDRCTCGNGRDKGGVESRSKAKSPLQEILPACRCSTRQPREGNEPPGSARYSGRQRPIRRPRSRSRRRNTACDRRYCNKHARAKGRTRAGLRGQSLKCRPCGGSQLVVDRCDHASGDRLLQR